MSEKKRADFSSPRSSNGSALEYTLTKMKMDELFVHWLSHRETNELIQQICVALNNDEKILSPAMPSVLAPCFGMTPDIPTCSPDRRSNIRSPKGNSPPPRSPTHHTNRSSQSPRSPLAAMGTNMTQSSYHQSSHTTTLFPHSPEVARKELEENSDSPTNRVKNEVSKEYSHIGTETAEAKKTIPLPRFYVKGEGGRGRGKRNSFDSFSSRRSEIEQVYQNKSRVGESEFVIITKDIIGLPSLVNRPLMRRIIELYDVSLQSVSSSEKASLTVSLEALHKFWDVEVEPFDQEERFFRLCKKTSASQVTVADLSSLVDEVLLYHPGLAFLHSHAEFMEKYALTVATRILYSANVSRSGFLTEKEMRRAGVLQAWQFVDMEEDINRCTLWFSYEHFYVLYCRFWELDSDHDGQLNREDLLRYGGHRLSRVIVDHIFDVGHRPGSSNGSVKRDNSMMKYDDFVYFMLSEEDKGNEAALSYWFTCVDGDGDGVITPMDMKVFYDVQSARMEALGHEVVSFEDILCQMNDMINPKKEGKVILDDLVRSDMIKHAGVIFDALFNLEKFVSFEQRDPFAERHKRDDPFDCDWDRFAYAEYNRLAQEEEAREEMDVDGHLDEWGDGERGVY